MRWKVDKELVVNGIKYHPGEYIDLPRTMLRDIDAYEGRVRAYHDELESIVALCGASTLMDLHVAKMERLSKLDTKNRTWNKFKTAQSLLGKAIAECQEHVNLEQMISLGNSTNNHTVHVSAIRKPNMINLTEEQIDLLVRAAMANKCSHCMAAMAEREWGACDLRTLFDTLLVRESGRERSNCSLGLCPYVRESEKDDD